MTLVREFVAPGPGPWELETAHFPRPISRFVIDPLVRAFAAGFAESAARYGLLLSHFKASPVNGFLYQQPVAFGAPEGAMGPPPGPILWLLTRLHPGMRARIAVCAKAFANKQWRLDLTHWDEVDRPKAVAAHLAIQAIDPAELSMPDLIQHLSRVHAHMEAMFRLHHKYTVTCTLPVGDYLSNAMEWTGACAGEALALLRGTSEISKGVAAAELEVLGRALANDVGALALLSGRDAAAILEALLSREDAVGAAARAYYEMVRFRAVGYDLSERSCGEMPDLLLKAIRATVENKSSAASLSDRAHKEAALRSRVPEVERTRFDGLLEEARLINRLRDERGVYSDGWATGLARRAVLEAGRRLVQTERLQHPEHAVDLTLEELSGLLQGAETPSAEEINARVIWRNTKTAADAPAFLRALPAPPPPPHLLPEAARRAGKAVSAVLDNLFKTSDRTHSKKVLRGLSVNTGTCEGTARLVLNGADFEKVKQGDVLVTAATSPYFNVVLPLLAGLVTDRGGQLCHAALVAREYGIPGVVGTKDATRMIPDGARVRIDGDSGEVTLLS